MAQIIFGKMTGLADSIYGKSEAPIKAFLEENVKAYTDSSMVEKIFKVVSSDNYAEKYSSLTGLAQGFLPVGEGGAYPKDERQEGFAKVLEHETWKDSFTITQEMIEDSKILDLKTYKVKVNINEITMATIKEEEYPIKDNGFEYLGNHYDCHYAIERDIKMILQEAETSHKDNFNEIYEGWKILFSSIQGSEEEERTIRLLEVIAKEAGQIGETDSEQLYSEDLY